MQGVLRERVKVPEHILLQERMVQSLEHPLHQDEVEQKGDYVSPVELTLKLNLTELKRKRGGFILCCFARFVTEGIILSYFAPLDYMRCAR